MKKERFVNHLLYLLSAAIEAIYSYLTPCELIFLGPVDVILLSKRALLLFCWLGVSLPAEEEHQEKDQDGEEGAR